MTNFKEQFEITLQNRLPRLKKRFKRILFCQFYTIGNLSRLFCLVRRASPLWKLVMLATYWIVVVRCKSNASDKSRGPRAGHWSKPQIIIMLTLFKQTYFTSPHYNSYVYINFQSLLKGKIKHKVWLKFSLGG
jgi:hypothetical protein